jgi:hypothetical protein
MKLIIDPKQELLDNQGKKRLAVPIFVIPPSTPTPSNAKAI